MPVALRYAARTDVGLVRSRNEDSGYAGPRLLAVADGMGGHAGGNVASSLTIGDLMHLDAASAKGSGGDAAGSAQEALQQLRASIRTANEALRVAMSHDPSLQGMGTTVTALLAADDHTLVLAHIGDSRGYLLRDGELAQITRDHSFVQDLVDQGRITPAEAEQHPQRSLVTRVLTGRPTDEPDLVLRDSRVGDRYLLCSDGLSDFVARDTIADVLSQGLDVGATAEALVALAIKAGAPDNVTCVVADVVDEQPGQVDGASVAGVTGPARAGDARGVGDRTAETPGPAATSLPYRPQVVGAAAERAPAGADQVEHTVPLSPSPSTKAASLRAKAAAAVAAPPLLRRSQPAEPEPTPDNDRLQAPATDAAGGRSAPPATPPASDEVAVAPVQLAEEGPRSGAARWGRRLVLLTLVLALLAGGSYAAYEWVQRQYYVGTSAGRVAVYQGIAQNVGPIRLSQVREATDIDVADLPQFYRDRVAATVSADSLAAARKVVTDLRVEAIRCQNQRATGITCGSGS